MKNLSTGGPTFYTKGDVVMLRDPAKWKRACWHPIGVVAAQPKTSHRITVRQFGLSHPTVWHVTCWQKLTLDAVRHLQRVGAIPTAFKPRGGYDGKKD